MAASQAAVLDAQESGLAVVVLVADLALLLAPDRKTGAGSFVSVDADLSFAAVLVSSASLAGADLLLLVNLLGVFLGGLKSCLLLQNLLDGGRNLSEVFVGDPEELASVVATLTPVAEVAQHGRVEAVEEAAPGRHRRAGQADGGQAGDQRGSGNHLRNQSPKNEIKTKVRFFGFGSKIKRS